MGNGFPIVVDAIPTEKGYFATLKRASLITSLFLPLLAVAAHAQLAAQVKPTEISAISVVLDASIIASPVAGAAQSGPGQLSPYEDPYDLIYAAEFTEKGPERITVTKLPEGAISTQPFDRDKPNPPRERPPERIHPVLVKWLQDRDPSEEEILIINFQDPISIPRFPNPHDHLPRDAEENRKILAVTEQMIADVKQQRDRYHSQLAKDLRHEYSAELIDNFWLVNGLVVKMPLGSVKRLLRRSDVLYVEPQSGGEKPPVTEALFGRQRIASDPYFNLGQAAGYIGLLDTGVRFSHTMFNSPRYLDLRYDCTDGVCNNVPDVSDDCWNHGTRSAGIISGNNNLGNLYRGVTRITLDSFKVYPSGCGFLDSTATVKAFEKAIAILNRVIVAEMQAGSGINGIISTAANNAFDAGAVIIAANGNNGGGGIAGSVNAPANAHRVLGVGNFDVQTQAQIDSQSRGPTTDNRIKPDIQAPTNTITASSTSDVAVAAYGGTSGATPYAAGAAALMRNWLRGNTGSIDPGQVYSHLILSGQQTFPFNNTSGAGPLVMPTGGHGYWGKKLVFNAHTIEVPVFVGAGRTKIEAALWWPESVVQAHNDIDLHIVSPSGQVMASSVSIPSVFERASYEASHSLQPGIWKVRIRGYSVPTLWQTVFWSARVR